MRKWTDDANRELKNYLDRVAQLATERGDDPSEIVEGLRDHVTQEAETNGETLITAERIRTILAQLGTPEEVVGIEETKATPSASPNVHVVGGPSETPTTSKIFSELENQHIAQAVQQRSGCWNRLLIFFTGIAVVDAFAAIFIAKGFALDDNFIMPAHYGNDLMPLPLHFWGLLVVPLAILYNFVTLYRQWYVKDNDNRPVLMQVTQPWRFRLGLILSGYGLIVSMYYMLVFLPMLPIAIFGILFLLGLLPLAPYFTFIIGAAQTVTLVRRAQKVCVSSHWAWLGIAIGFTIYGGWTIHHYACKNAIELAFSADAEQRAEGIRKIKSLHGENKVLLGCHRSFPQIFMTTENWDRFHNREEFQALYYRMTGRDYREVIRSEIVQNRTRRAEWENEWEIDEEVGGAAVRTRIEKLSLYSSTIDAVVAGDREQNNAGPCVAYLQWVMEFKNDSDRQREARCQIQMPPGSVGSPQKRSKRPNRRSNRSTASPRRKIRTTSFGSRWVNGFIPSVKPT